MNKTTKFYFKIKIYWKAHYKTLKWKILKIKKYKLIKKINKDL